MYNINLGLCCINNTLREDARDWLMSTNKITKRPRGKVPIFCSRTINNRKYYSVQRAQELALQNTRDLSYLIEWNQQHNIQHLRISSDMFPRFTDPEVESYTIDFAHKHLDDASKLIHEWKHRVTFHPGQFNQIGTKSPKIFEATCHDLLHHASIFDHMNIDESGILCIHGGGVYGDKEGTKRRWIEQFDDLPTPVKPRIALENCEKCYSVRDCLDLSEACRIPVIVDTHHYMCYNHFHPNEQQEELEHLVQEAVDTWKHARPLFHISDQAQNKPVGSHHDFIEAIPSALLQLSKEITIDIEVEAKAKEAAIFRLKQKYGL